MKTSSRARQKARFTKGQRPFFRNFVKNWKMFTKSRIGLTGVGILVFFTAFALSAGFLAMNDPLHDQNVAAADAKPEWLHDSNQYSNNFGFPEDPSFSHEVDALSQWVISIPSGLSQNVSVAWLPSGGDPSGSGGAHIVVRLVRTDSSSPLGQFLVMFNITKYYPFTSPSRFAGDLRWKTELQTGELNYTYQLVLTRNGDAYRDVNGTEFRQIMLFSSKLMSGKCNWTNTFIQESKSLDTNSVNVKRAVALAFGYVNPRTHVPSTLVDAGNLTFPSPSSYTVSYVFNFTDSKIGTPLQAEIHIDDLNFFVYGDNYGLLGTDQYGRDLFSQLVHGTMISLFIGVTAALVAVALGIVVGLISGYYGGGLDEVLMRINDFLLIIPGLPLLIVLMAVLGASIWNVIIVVGFLGWMGIARLIRSQVLTLKERPFIESAKAAGASDGYIMTKHIFPNVVPLAYSQLALTVPAAILTEAALSFLGLGDPSVPTWGQMFYNAWIHATFLNWWWTIPPGLCIALLSLSFVFIGYALDEVFNPKLRQR